MVNVERLLKFGAAALIATIVSSCSPKKSGSSSLTIQLPSHSSQSNSQSNKAASQNVSALSFNFAVACFAVNVTGDGIPQSSNSCAPTVGVFSGFKPAGSTITMQVPQGPARKLELFVFNRAQGAEPCPADFSAVSPDKISRVGEVDHIDMTQPDVTVAVDAYMNASNLVSQYSLPVTCIATGPAGLGSAQQIILGAAHISSASYTVQGQVTYKRTMTELSNANYKMLLGPKGL